MGVSDYFDRKFDQIRSDFHGNPDVDNTSIMSFTIGIFGLGTSFGVARYQNEFTGVTDYSVFNDVSLATPDYSPFTLSYDRGNFLGNASDLQGYTIGAEGGVLVYGEKFETPFMDDEFNIFLPDLNRGTGTTDSYGITTFGGSLVVTHGKVWGADYITVDGETVAADVIESEWDKALFGEPGTFGEPGRFDTPQTYP